MIIFTSGTAGRPKAMEPSHRSPLVDLRMLQLTRRLSHHVDEHPAMLAMWHLHRDCCPSTAPGRSTSRARSTRPRRWAWYGRGTVADTSIAMTPTEATQALFDKGY